MLTQKEEFSLYVVIDYHAKQWTYYW